jgi:hypothetical protein
MPVANTDRNDSRRDCHRAAQCDADEKREVAVRDRRAEHRAVVVESLQHNRSVFRRQMRK